MLENKSKVDHSFIHQIFLRPDIVLATENVRVKVDRHDPSPYRAHDMYPVSPFY